MLRILSLSVLALSLTACGPKPAPKREEPPIAAAPACPDDGPRLPETGVCLGRVGAYLSPAEGAAQPKLPEGCSWTYEETMLPGDEALLYRTMACKGVTTKLAFEGGAHHASLTYAKSALRGDAVKDLEVVQLWGVDPDPQGALKAALAALPKGEQEKCAVEPADAEGLPKDALVIHPKGKTAAVTACGPNGVEANAVAYWRIRQGQAWFVKYDPKTLDFDPGTLTIIAKGPEGGWGAKPE